MAQPVLVVKAQVTRPGVRCVLLWSGMRPTAGAWASRGPAWPGRSRGDSWAPGPAAPTRTCPLAITSGPSGRQDVNGSAALAATSSGQMTTGAGLPAARL